MTPPVAAALREGLVLVLLGAAPPLLGATLGGAAAGLVTGRRDVAGAALGRVLVGLAVLALCAPWLMGALVRFTTALLLAVPHLGRT